LLNFEIDIAEAVIGCRLSVIGWLTTFQITDNR
jgi:hypothetical protein